MSLNIKNDQVEQLLDEVVQLTGETKTEAVRKALEERNRSLALQFMQGRGEKHLLAFLEDEVWPRIPTELLGIRLSKAQEESILGYGDLGL